MDIHEITPDYFVAPQIDPDDMAGIVAAGIRTIICNRPDMEIPPSHHAAVMEKAALEAGLAFHILPLTHQNMIPEVIAQQMEHAANNTPVLAYCASGTRCTVAWALGNAAQGEDIDGILAAVTQAGYPLDGLRPTLQAARATGT